MASQLDLPRLVVDVSDDETSYSQQLVPSEQESTTESANSSSSINKSKFTFHFRYSDKYKKFQCNYYRILCASVCFLKAGLSLGT